MHDLCGAREAAGICDRDKGAQLIDIDEGGHGPAPEAKSNTSPIVIGKIRNIRFTYQSAFATFSRQSKRQVI
jgi:hypothetical protein